MTSSIISSVKNTFNGQVEGEDVLEIVDFTAATKKDKKSKCQKVKSSGPLIVTICFAVSIIVMIFYTPTLFFDDLLNPDYLYCKSGKFRDYSITNDIACKGWVEFRY